MTNPKQGCAVMQVTDEMHTRIRAYCASEKGSQNEVRQAIALADLVCRNEMTIHAALAALSAAPVAEPVGWDRDALAKTVLDGWTEGNETWDDAPSHIQDRCYFVADAILKTPPTQEQSAPNEREAAKVAALNWRKPNEWDHGHEGSVACADGLGGRYSITEGVGETYELWWAHDGFDHITCANLKDAKAKAEEDWQKRMSRNLKTDGGARG